MIIALKEVESFGSLEELRERQVSFEHVLMQNHTYMVINIYVDCVENI